MVVESRGRTPPPIVTGGAAGIGRATALRLATDGADIAVLDLDEDGLAETSQLVEGTGRRCLPVRVDLLDRDDITAAFATVKAELGPVAILHNNAVCPGATRTALAEAFDDEHRQQTLATTPLGRLAEPEEIAHAVAFFASPGASYVIGEHLLVTGGRTTH